MNSNFLTYTWVDLPADHSMHVLPMLGLQFGAVPPPRLLYQRRQLKLHAYLGTGATATAYECRLPPAPGSSAVGAGEAGGDGESVVAKVALSQEAVHHEQSVLSQLRQLFPGVPHVLGVLDGGQGLLLQPVGTPLSSRTMEQNPRRVKQGNG